ncbi:2-oxoglutarate and Fe(II)-dependent oxygenase superfamily protein [Prunus dulcis]|uniref:2-oxoglutarate and Fe(II)-dependent oxygenase superfamily protein n=1 Tax=Prunus dulcis TaxID=3755 RepID=A0A4Y1R4G6_PRUDU|nr:2-oxoglutarate and Fe(II)-dependent oxygenase superfamily protein [Prunus dulcis]
MGGGSSSPPPLLLFHWENIQLFHCKNLTEVGLQREGQLSHESSSKTQGKTASFLFPSLSTKPAYHNGLKNPSQTSRHRFLQPKPNSRHQRVEHSESPSPQCLEEYGCFEHCSPKSLHTFEKLLDLPLQTKLKNVSRKPYRGYAGELPMMPLYESMGIDGANVYEQVQSLANTFKTIQSFTEKVSELDQIIRRMILESLGLEEYLDEHLNSTDYLLRVMKYKAPQTNETKLGLPAHTDKNIVTILYQNQVDGLEVQTKDGKWINVKPSSDSFIALIGESLHAWTNGRLHSPIHKVMMNGNEARYSIGLYSAPKEGYIIKAPNEVVDEEHPLLFKPYEHAQFIAFCNSEAGQRGPLSLKTFCETPLKLPITDYSKQALTPGSKEWETVRTQVHNAPEEYGCFEALFYKVPPHIRNKTIQSFSEQLTNYLLRMIKYKGSQTETKLRLPAHTNKNIVTILHQNQVDGLEVQTKDGKWIYVNPSSDSFITMIDLLYAWTNGRLHSPYHRVMMSGNEARYSTGLFSILKEGYIIKASDEVVDEEHQGRTQKYELVGS